MNTRDWFQQRQRARVAARQALFLSALALLCGAVPAALRVSAQSPPALDGTLRGLFLRHEFSPKTFGPARWLRDGSAYVTVEPSAPVPGASDLIRYDTATGKREVLVSASELKTGGSAKPLAIEGYEWSEDMKRLLIFTHSVRVWRQHTLGDYWALDRTTRALHRLGGSAPEQSLMFAKLSPD